MIEFEQVSRNYGEKIAVDRLDLVIPPGELFAFLGPNGAGKTTTIKMLVGLLRPTSGTVKVCGRDVARDTREANRLVGYVPDEPHLYDKLTGREFLRFIADMFGLEATQALARLERVVRQFELETFVDELTENYSHGMKQRTVFAAAMLHDPAVLVVDEPMVGLDPHSVRMVKDLLQVQARQGVTVFMSTHTLAVAEEIADRIGVVHNGRVVFLGTLAELRHRLEMHDKTLEALYLELIGQERGVEAASESGILRSDASATREPTPEARDS
jgi:ABC-2 type transport system ATP-binding protein